MSTLERAIALAARAHEGQLDKAGAPYILHPLRIMLQLRKSDEQMAAVLHDVVEDCGWTLDQLRKEGFSETVVAAVDSVTNRAGEKYEDFVLRASKDPIGRLIKLADLQDNCDLSRIANPTDKDFERIEKYKRAIAAITDLMGAADAKKKTKNDTSQATKKILYVDMDNVLVDFQSALPHFPPEVLKEYGGDVDDIPGIFAKMEPMKDALDSFASLSEKFDTYILSTAPWNNPSAWSDKLAWVKKHLGQPAFKRLILTHHKNLNAGDYLIDDRTKKGADKFPGELIHFGSERFPDWKSVVNYLIPVRV